MNPDRFLRIALFSGNYNYLREGANQALNQLVDFLERRGHAVRVYSPITDRPAFEPKGTLVAVPSVTLPVRREFQLALRLPPFIRRDVERFTPDLIHVSTPDILGTRAETLAERLRVPIVASMHTRFETYLEHYGLGWLKSVAEAHLRRFYRRADCVLVPTSGLIEEMQRLRGDDRVLLWSRGVDRELFNPSRRDPEWRAAHGCAPGDVLVLYFGRIVLEKGIDKYVEAIRLLRASAYNVRPLVVGDGPAADRLRALEGCIITGHLQGPRLARAVASADIMISPSTTEAFGNVVLEAMACGVAIVSADAPSARALLDPERTGVLCRPDRPVDFARAVASLIDNDDNRLRMGKAAVEASQAYSWNAASSAVEEAYRSVIWRVDQRTNAVPMTL